MTRVAAGQVSLSFAITSPFGGSYLAPRFLSNRLALFWHLGGGPRTIRGWWPTSLHSGVTSHRDDLFLTSARRSQVSCRPRRERTRDRRATARRRADHVRGPAQAQGEFGSPDFAPGA